MFKRLSKRAQTTAEYALVIALVVGAVVAMQVYVKRGLQGRVRQVADYTGNDLYTNSGSTFTFNGDQYEPYYSEQTANRAQNAQTDSGMTTGGGVTSNVVSNARANTNAVTGWGN